MEEQLLYEITKVTNKLLNLEYDVGCIFKIKIGYTSKLDELIKSTTHYSRFGILNDNVPFRFFIINKVKWNNLELKYMLDNYIKIIDMSDFLLIKINSDLNSNNQCDLYNDISGDWINNPLNFGSRYKLTYDSILLPKFTSSRVSCNICNASLPYHDPMCLHSNHLHCTHTHHKDTSDVYIHIQEELSQNWKIIHNKENINFVYVCYNNDGEVIFPVSMINLDENSFELNFSTEIKGKVVVF